MPPKNKGKKGKKGDDEDYWASKEAAVKTNIAAPESDDEPASKPAAKKANLFDMLDEGAGDDEENEGGEGGLLATIRASNTKKEKKKKGKKMDEDEPLDDIDLESKAPQKANLEDEWPEDDVKPKKGKKDKKKGKKADEDEEPMEVDLKAKAPPKPSLDDEWPEEDVKPKKGKKAKGKKGKDVDDAEEEQDIPAEEPPVVDLETKAPVKADIDEEWPEEDVKPKKGKKAKGKKGKTADEDDDVLEQANGAEEVTAVPPEFVAPDVADVEANEEDEDKDDGDVKILSKKEKEKLKKEKEKAKKKAQAAAKKGGAGETAADSPTQPNTVTESAPIEAVDEDDEGEDEGGAAGGANKKKKKKKPAAKVAEPVAPKGKKPSAHVLALQKALEESKRKEEEARLAAEAEQRRIDEEEARIAAEEQAAADALAAKRAKEKAKREQLKADGKLLTPAQKRERAAAEARKQALLSASGMKVAGLAQSTEGSSEKKKVSYGSRKKGPAKGPAAASPKLPEPVEEETVPESPAPVQVEEPASKGEPIEVDGDDWDKSSDDEAAVEAVISGMGKMEVNDDEDDWDKSDTETPAPASKPNAIPVSSAPPAVKAPTKSTPIQPAPTKATAAPNGKATGKQRNGKPAESESESEEETSDDDSSEEDSDDSDDSDESDSDDGMTKEEREAEERKQRTMAKIQDRQKAAAAAGSKDDLRSPICVILGHVDTGKTKLLDKIRQTSVQEGEAGGITQQIGATFFPKEALITKTEVVNRDGSTPVKIPGLLIIDTPGHESFTNLRSRGSSLCNIAILVVDITHGLEPTTIESLNLLRQRKTPFIVALNKIDRMYGWNPTADGGFRESLNQQSKSTRSEFEDRLARTKVAFAEQGLNAELFDENKNLGRNISLVPTSAITGEGIPDMLLLLVKLTQERMNASLMYISELECTILEVKVIEGLGTTIDVVLVNGVMKEGDKIVLCGLNGPIVTNVRALLTPQPMRELRVKSAYVHNKEVKAALGVKISAPGLEKAIAGSKLYVANDDDEVEALKDLAMEDLTSLSKFVEKGGRGVFVQASTLGSLEALLTFLQQMRIPVSDFGIGPVYKSTVVRAGIMLDRAPEFAVILSFDVAVDREATELANREGVKIFSAMIIYHLFDAFTKYMADVQEARRKEAAPNAVWPVRLKVLRAFANRDPIVLGVDIIDGTMKVGTPVGVVRNDKETGKREIVTLGKITSIEINHKPFETVKKNQIGAGAAVKIERASYQAAKSYGRHFDEKDEIVSLITRTSIDVLKNTFREQVELSDWALIKKMKIEQGVN